MRKYGLTVGYLFDCYVRIRNSFLISSARKYLLFRHLSAWSRNVETAAGCEIGTGLTMVATE